MIQRITDFPKTSALGGLFVLLPLLLFYLLLSQALQAIVALARPIADLFPKGWFDKVIWGVGPSINLPTATSGRRQVFLSRPVDLIVADQTSDQLGSGKWSAGVTAVALTQPSWGSMGILGRQLWSFAGDSNRSSVNQTLIEPFVNYNLEDGWFLVTDSVITAN